MPDLLLWDYEGLPDDPEVRVRRLLMTFPYSFMLAAGNFRQVSCRKHFRKQDVQYVEKHRDRLFKNEDPRFAILWDSMKKKLFPKDWWS